MEREREPHFYQDEDGLWRWRRVSANGQIFGASHEGFDTRPSAERNYKLNHPEWRPTRSSELEQKFLVVKMSRMEELRAKFASTPYGLRALDDVASSHLDDAVVLRGQDSFAAAAIHRYVDDVWARAKITSDPEVRDQLQRLADHMSEVADMVDRFPTKKIPD